MKLWTWQTRNTYKRLAIVASPVIYRNVREAGCSWNIEKFHFRIFS